MIMHINISKTCSLAILFDGISDNYWNGIIYINIKNFSFTVRKYANSEKIDHTEYTDHNCLSISFHQIKPSN